MSLLNNLTIGRRLAVLLTLMILLAGGITAIAVSSLAQLAAGSKHLLLENAVPDSQLGDILRRLSEGRSQVLLTLQHDPSTSFAAMDDHPQTMHADNITRLHQENEVLWQQFMAHTIDQEERPLIAAFQLYSEALSDSGLREGGVINPVIDAVLKRRKMKRTPTVLNIKLDDPRAALADFRKETLKPEDLACFSKTLDVIEGDQPHVAARAKAWAVGDWPALRSGARQDWQQACELAWFNTETARKRGISDVEARMQARWMEVAEGALQKNRITFATVPVWQLVKPGGYLAALQAKGYEVEAPE